MTGEKRLIPWVAALVVVLVLPYVIYPVLALDILLWGLFAVALDLLLGLAGLLSFGHAMFWGSAGYAAGILTMKLGVPFPVAVLGGMALAILLSVPIGFLSIRLKGIYFAMVTLAFAQMIFYVVNEWRDMTGGENGLQGILRYFPGVSLADSTVFYYAALPLILLGFWLAYRIVHSPFGHVLVAIRDNEARAQMLGYQTQRYKLLGFVISAGLSGLAGSLYALSHGFATLDSVHWSTSGTVVVMTILGGIGTLWGSVVGAALFLLLRDFLSTWTDAWGIVTGIIFAVVVLNFRRGIWGTLLHARLNRIFAVRPQAPETATDSTSPSTAPGRATEAQQ
jgi:branched-chain amino acid transport system permease protein